MFDYNLNKNQDILTEKEYFILSPFDNRLCSGDKRLNLAFSLKY
jgi:hypothetical protein